MLKIIGKLILRFILATAVVLAGDIGLYYLMVFVL